jgi:hypothetical protein
MKMLRIAWVAAVVLPPVTEAAACGGSSNDTGGPTGGTGGSGGASDLDASADSSATGGSGGLIGDGGVATGCNPPCDAPQFCSVTKVCIDQGTCRDPGDCQEGMTCDTSTSSCVPGSECGSQEAQTEAIPPNLLIVLDRSCSMRKLVGTQTKWQIAVAALEYLTTQFSGKIRFGLTLFPDTVTPDCKQGAIPIPVAPGNEAAIQDLLDASLASSDPNYPDGPCVTNIDTALTQAATEPALDDPERKSFILLVTDGKQAGCSAAGGDQGTTQAITDLYQNRGVPTFVVGFGAEIDPAQMNIFAAAGGVPNPDPNVDYYQAEDQTSLQAAFDSIATQTLGCTYVLDKTPDDPDKIYVFFDNTQEVPRDSSHQNGWDYDPSTNQVTFYGEACEDLKTGTVTDVDIVLGCKAPTPN